MIIDVLMAMTDRTGETRRAQLKHLLEAEPARPEIALARYLLATRPYLGGPGGEAE